MNGEVGHDVIAAAGAVTMGRDARIAHNAYTAGASVENQAGSQIGGSLLIGAGQGLVSGQITNDLLAGTQPPAPGKHRGPQCEDHRRLVDPTLFALLHVRPEHAGDALRPGRPDLRP